MKCPQCGNTSNKVIDSRPTKDRNAIRRRRECDNCSHRFTTYEYIETVSFVVIKQDGRREPFDTNKLRLGIQTACKKLPISLETIDHIIIEIENELSNLAKREIPTKIIGELVMKHLQKLNEVAYVRFVSVYHEFKDIKQFMEELNKLNKN